MATYGTFAEPQFPSRHGAECAIRLAPVAFVEFRSQTHLTPTVTALTAHTKLLPAIFACATFSIRNILPRAVLVAGALVWNKKEAWVA